MLTTLGFGMVSTFMYLIMSKRLSPLVGLIVIPLLFALAGGFAAGMGSMMLNGIRKLAPTGVMLTFAILYFGVMIDAGLFDRLVSAIVRAVEGDPLKVVVGTAVLALFVSLDGDGSTTYMVTVSSMLPLYKRMRLNLLHLTCVTMLASGVMNLSPWGGPTTRAASALHIDPAEVFVPLLPAIAAGVAGVILLSYFLGLRERRRLGRLSTQELAPAKDEGVEQRLASGSSADLRRPKLLWVNAALTVALILALIIGILPLPVLFMLGFALAILVNYPKLEDQRRSIGGHAQNVIAVVSLIFAAGIFTGILSGTGMVEAMSKSLLAIVPPALGPHLAVFTALVSMPFTFFVSNDAFYYGVLPTIAKAAHAYGITPPEIARASLIGQPVHLLSPLVPSTYLLVGLAGVDLGDHQRFTLKWAALISLLLMLVALACALFPLAAVVR